MYRYSLKKGQQITCPQCGKKKFSPYIDLITGVSLNEDLCGKCSRENNCGYHYPPRTLFLEYPEFIPTDNPGDIVEEYIIKKEVSLMDETFMKRTLSVNKNNSLISFLFTFLQKENVLNSMEEYFIGFEGDMIIFWQVDADGEIRTGKKMLYNIDGRRDKKHLYLMHREIYKEDYNVEECFFGEHLLKKYPKKNVQIVESEKTALICYTLWPEFIWLSTGGKTKWLINSWERLADRRIVLVPDEDAIEEWEEMQSEMQMIGLDVSIDNICKDKAPQSDIADIIVEELNQNRD